MFIKPLHMREKKNWIDHCDGFKFPRTPFFNNNKRLIIWKSINIQVIGKMLIPGIGQEKHCC